ncbi:MAG TPA: hypothetical protein VFL84_09500 [Gammaproteobacteria bacterium]|nr:hypothetical protein [Gammaproteobacteria bacterium]
MPACSENPAYCATPRLGSSARAGTLCNENTLLDERGVKNRYLWIDPRSDGAQALAAKLGCSFVFDSLDIDCA